MQYAGGNLTGGWVVLQSEVDVFLDTKAKAAGVGEVLALELVLLHLKPSLKDLQRLIAADLCNQVSSTGVIQHQAVQQYAMNQIT